MAKGIKDASADVSAQYLRGLDDYLQVKGLNAEDFWQRHGLSQAALAQARRRVSLAAWEALLDDASLLVGDADLGLHAGEHIRPGHYGVLGYGAMACPRVADIIQRHMRYEKLVATIGISRYSRHGDRMRLVWDTGTRRLSRHVIDETLASWVSFARWIVGQPVNPLVAGFAYPEPTSTREHQRLFACPLQFGVEHAWLEFPASYLTLRLAQFDAEVCRIMEVRAEEELRALGEADLPARLREVILDRLASGDLTLALAAEALGLSERALQRRLQARGLSYQQVLDDARRGLALEYIGQPWLSLTDMAFLLGFADQSVFQRAFRQWTGETPGRYRRREARASSPG